MKNRGLHSNIQGDATTIVSVKNFSLQFLAQFSPNAHRTNGQASKFTTNLRDLIKIEKWGHKIHIYHKQHIFPV